MNSAITQLKDSPGDAKYFFGTTEIITVRQEQQNIINQILSELESKNSGLESTLSMKNDKLETTNRELKMKNEKLERSAFIASHDLREPVRNIISYLTPLKMKLRDELSSDSFK